MNNPYPRKLPLLWGFFAFFVGFTGISQTEVFSGKLSAGGFTGTAEFPFNLVNGDTIPNGTFLMYKSNVDALLKEKDSFFSFSGTFDEGYPEGFWKFQFGEFSSNNSSQVVGYQYRLNVSGIQHDAFGNLVEGKPDGDWVYKIAKVENSEVLEVLFNSKITYNNGVPQQSFQIENNSSTLVGRFLRDGLAHDVWVVYSDSGSNPVESWYFENGLLQKIEKETADGTLVLNVFGETSIQYRNIPLDIGYLKLVKWYLQQSSSQADTKNMNMFQLLEQNSEQYGSIDVFFNDLGKAEFMPSFKARVPYYPMDSIEVKQLQTIRTNYESSLKIGNVLMDNPQFGLLAHSNPKAAYYYKVVERFIQDFLAPVGKFLAYEDENILEFVSRESLVNQIWPQGLPNSSIEISGTEQPNEVWEPESNTTYSFTVLDFNTILSMLRYSESSLERISSEMAIWLEEAEKQQQFLQLDETLVQEAKKLETKVDSLSTAMDEKFSTALSGILQTKESVLTTYAQMEQSNAKLEYGKEALECIKNLSVLASKLGELPEQERLLVEKYQDAFWNPFTATIMDEAVKKRILAAYKNQIVPFILSSVSKPIECDDVTRMNHLIDNVHLRLTELREQPTKKLERKLRKEQDPEVILQLLGMESNAKTDNR